MNNLQNQNMIIISLLWEIVLTHGWKLLVWETTILAKQSIFLSSFEGFTTLCLMSPLLPKYAPWGLELKYLEVANFYILDH